MNTPQTHVVEGSQWIAKWARPNDAMVWTIQGVTDRGVFFTCPESRSPGHLLSVVGFLSQYAPHDSEAAHYEALAAAQADPHDTDARF
jgi:hypothetical protein